MPKLLSRCAKSTVRRHRHNFQWHDSIQGGSTIDAYNSANGPYSAATVITNGAVLLTDSTANPAVTIQGGTFINGNVVTGPGGTVSEGSGSVTGTIAHNANVQINPNSAPSSALNYSIVEAGGIVGGTNYDVVATNGNYKWSTLGLGGGIINGTTMAVSGNVNIYLYQTGNNVLVVGGSGFIYITPGSSLTIYTAGNASISGSGIVNPSQDANTCSIIGLPTCTQVALSGHNNFYGTINAPEAAFTFSAGSTMQSFGSFIVGSAVISGSLHFNENR